MNRHFIPWTILTVLAFLVLGLTYRAENYIPPDPTYDFYDTAFVKVQIHGSNGIHDLFGRYNHILHGNRVLIKAEETGQGEYLLEFPVFSPRPAVLFVDDEALEIFLQPGDTTLNVEMWYTPATYAFDSIRYTGTMAPVCEYYLSKSTEFNRVHIRGMSNTVGTDDFGKFSARLDSMAAWELGLLAQQQVFSDLPEWFVKFERNDILYQKAYLKLSQSFNRDVDQSLLDNLPADNQDAEFSYYYYLYLHTFFSKNESRPAANDSIGQIQEVERQLSLADQSLIGSPHDVFMTRVVYSLIQQGKLDEAGEILKQFKGKFKSKKYFRYLKATLQNATPMISLVQKVKHQSVS